MYAKNSEMCNAAVYLLMFSTNLNVNNIRVDMTTIFMFIEQYYLRVTMQ